MPQDGDIAIKVMAQDGRAAYEWIAYDQVQKPAKQTAGLSELWIAAANAAVVAQPSVSARSGPIQRTQAEMEVLREAIQGKKVVRVIKDGDKCFREIVLPSRGILERRQEISCNTPCG
jgi:hypothetical protein